MDLDDVLFPKEEDDFQAREEELKSVKQNLDIYKKTISLLKTKMIKSDVLIRQYSDKIKECDLLTEELSTIKAEKQDVLNKCNLMMEKVARLELESLDYKQSSDRYKRLSETQKLKLDENEKLITQYNFKIKSLEMEKAELEDNMKTQQENLKAIKAKENEKKQTKHKGCQTLRVEKRDFSANANFVPSKPEKCDFSTNVNFVSPKPEKCDFSVNTCINPAGSEKHDFSMNTDLAVCETDKSDLFINSHFTSFKPEKPPMQDQIIMTDEILRTEPFPIFCTKCEKFIDPVPINQILKIMSFPPPLLSEQISPPNSPGTSMELIKIQKAFQNNSYTHNEKSSIVQSQVFDSESKDVNKQIQIPQEIDKPSFLELARRVDKLEHLLNKKKKKIKKYPTDNQCCTSKNIKLINVVKVPHEKELYEYRKREKRKLKKIKRLKTKALKINKHKNLDNNKWVVEHCAKSSANNEIVVDETKKNLRKRNAIHRKKEIDLLFESPEHSIPEENINSVRLSPLSETLSPSNKNSPRSLKSLSPSKSLPEVNKSSKLGIKKKLFVENVNMQKSVEKSSSDVDINLSYSSLSSLISVSESINESIVRKDESRTSMKNSSSNNNNLHISNMPVLIENNKENLHISTISVLLENNEENRQITLSNQVKTQDSSLSAEVFVERIDNIENFSIEHNINNLIEEEEEGEKESVKINELNDSLTKENIDYEKISKPTENLVPLLNSQNNVPQSPINTKNTEKSDEIISTDEQNLNLDLPLYPLNEEKRIYSNVFIETRNRFNTKFDSNVDDNKEKGEICTKNAVRNTHSIQESTEQYYVNENDVNILDKTDVNSLNKNFTSEVVKSAENDDIIDDSINEEVPKCISSESQRDVLKSILVEESISAALPIIGITQNTQEDLLTTLTKITDEENSSNKCLLSKTPVSPEKLKATENVPCQNTQKDLPRMLTDNPDKEAFNNECPVSRTLLSPEKVKVAENMHSMEECILSETPISPEKLKTTENVPCQNTQQNLLSILADTQNEEIISNECTMSRTPLSPEKLTAAEKMQVFKETEKNNEGDSRTIQLESCDIFSTTRVTRSSSVLRQTKEEDVVMNENKIEDNVSTDDAPDVNFRNAHSLPIMPRFQRPRSMSTPAVEKSEEIPTPIPSVSIHIDGDNSLSPVESKSLESVNENSNSSNMSSETKCFSLSGIKRGKIGKARNFITSEESSEDCSIDSTCTRKRKNSDSDRESPLTVKKVFTRIDSLRKSFDDPESLKKMLSSIPGSQELLSEMNETTLPLETSIPSPVSTSSLITKTSTTISIDTPPYIPTKKQRIAHTPKNVASNTSIENKQETSKMVKKKKVIKKSKSEPDDKISELLEVFDKTCKERKQIYRNLKPPQPPVPPDESLRSLLDTTSPKSTLIPEPENIPLPQLVKKPRGRPPKNPGKKLNVINRISESSVDSDASQPSLIIEESKQSEIISPPGGRPSRKTPKKLNNTKESLEVSVNSDLSKMETTIEEGEINNTIQLLPRRLPRKVLKKSRNTNENFQTSAEVRDEENDTLDGTEEGEIDDETSLTADARSDISSTMQDETQYTESKKYGRKNIVNMVEDDKSPMRELRSRQVAISQNMPKVTSKTKPKSTKTTFNQINETNSCLRESIMRSSLNKFLCTRKLSNRLGRTQRYNEILLENEMTCHDQFDLLMDSEEWTTELNSQVMENLLSSQDLKTIAYSIVEYAAEKCPENEPLDKCNTPPAPMMPRSEQKMVTLINSINQKHQEFNGMVEKGLEYKLFRLGVAQSVQMVERLFRILVVLNKIKKDREKVRMFCCDALYCLGLRATNIIYVALTCWPEVFPKHDSNNDIIVKTIVHIVMTLEVTEPYPKLNSLRKLLSTYYEYPNSGYMTNDFRIELMKNLEENAPGINTAVLILCKKLGPNWTLNNIIKAGLKHMIVTQTHPSLYDALTLLGNLLRSFPIGDPNQNVGEIIDQLCDVLDGNAGSDDLQEGIVSCLLSINKFRYEQIARTVIKWQFNKELRSATKMKLISFFKVHDTTWWWNFVHTNFPLPLEN